MAGVKGRSGGVRPGQGRKTKAEELGLPMLIEDVIGLEGKRSLVAKINDQAQKGSFPHQQLLMNYAFGKPKENTDVSGNLTIIVKRG